MYFPLFCLLCSIFAWILLRQAFKATRSLPAWSGTRRRAWSLQAADFLRTTWFIHVYDVRAGNDTSVHKPHHPLQPLSGRWKLEYECFAILSCPKMYAASVPAPLARFVGSKQKERFGNLASKGATIGEGIGRINCMQNLWNFTFICIKIYSRVSRLTIIK